MIGTMRKHQSWLWAIIIGVTIFTFVVYFQPGSRSGGMFNDRGRGYNIGSINGKEITPEDFIAARNEVELFFFIRYHEWPKGNMPGFDLERETYNRLLIIEKLKQLKVEVGEDATAQMVTEIFGGQSGKFSMDQYQNFMKEIAPQRLGPADFERLVQHEVGQQHLISLYGMSGKLLTPQEAEMLFRHENEVMNVDAVFFSSTNYLSQVVVNETNLQHYFEQNMPQYRIPDKVQISYVRFDASNSFAFADGKLATMTNLNMIAQNAYQQKGGPNFFKDEKGKGLSFEEALPKIKELFRMELANADAGKKASDFITDLDAVAATKTTQAEKLAALNKVATDKNYVVKDPPALDESMTMLDFHDMKLSPQIRQAAFSLTEEEPFTTSPVKGEDAYYFVALKNKIPGRNAEFAGVKEKVTHDYKTTEARKAARRACDKFAQDLTKALTAGHTFANTCTQEKVKSEALPPFSLSTRSLPELKGRVELANLQNAASRLAEGKSSDFLGTEDGGAVLYLRSRVPVTPEKLKLELPEFSRNMAEQRQYAAFSQWKDQLATELNLTVPQSMTKTKK